jgi:hypothetical protein
MCVWMTLVLVTSPLLIPESPITWLKMSLSDMFLKTLVFRPRWSSCDGS